ncbi:hypothetical protein GYMLUDRAFT_39115 [Collybiopsis luxurians FD-317 M1]|nr:hypothetical protein GYMLUDRAFT_39115 [Collybiopsis luxurians FD-317 M1]
MVESSTPSQGHDRASTTLPRVSSPNNPIPAASSADKAKAPDKKKLPTLTELLSARKAQAAAAGSPNKNKNTLALVSSPLNRKARLTELASTVAPEPIAIGTTAVETKDPPGRTSKESVQDSPGDDAAVLAPSDRGVSNNDVDIGQRKITQVPPAILETQASSSVMTATSSVQHQPEYTASGYAIDLPLSIIDGYVSRGVGAEDREQVGRKDKDPERGKISEKKMGHFGMDDVDTSPTKGRRGIVRPFVDAFEDEEEDDGTVLPRMEFSAFNESQLPDFTNNFSAFDPPQVSTQPRHSGGGQSRGGGGGNRARYGFGARPWESAGVDLDDEEEDEEDLDNDAGTSDYGYSAPQAIFTKDGVINVRSLDDDPTGQSPAFFSIPGLNSPIKKNRGRNHEAQTAFPFGYSSQMDVDGDVELVQRAMDRDGIMMDEDEEDGDHRMWGVGWP